VVEYTSLLIIPAILLSTADRTSIGQIALYLMQNVEHKLDASGPTGILGYETWLFVRRKGAMAPCKTSETLQNSIGQVSSRHRPEVALARDKSEDLGVLSIYTFFLAVCVFLCIGFTACAVPILTNDSAAKQGASAAAEASQKISNGTANIVDSEPVLKPRDNQSDCIIISAICLDVAMVLLLCRRFNNSMNCILEPPTPIRHIAKIPLSNVLPLVTPDQRSNS
jgi:hypothetical protein